MKFIETWKEVNAFHQKYGAVSALVWLFSLLLSAPFTFPRHWDSDVAMLAFMTVGLAYLALSVLSRYEAALIERINVDGEAPTWRVSINGVVVGTLSDSSYAAILHRVFFDVRTYVAQLVNLANVLRRVVDSLLVGIPVGVFWCGLTCYFLAPNVFASILAELQKAMSAQITSGTHAIVAVLVLTAFLLIGAGVIIGRGFGFVNRFDQASNAGIRRAIGCAAEGDVFLFRFIGDNMNDDLAVNELDCEPNRG